MIVAFHKPFGVLSQFTGDGSPNRALAGFGFPKNVYAIGRLDADSEGLLLLSDEARWNERLLHPRHAHEREYWAQVERIPTREALDRLQRGVMIQERKTLPCRAWVLGPGDYLEMREESRLETTGALKHGLDMAGQTPALGRPQTETTIPLRQPGGVSGWPRPAGLETGATRGSNQPLKIYPRTPPIRYRKSVPECWIGLELVEGKNRQVRRMTAAIGHPTLRLVRVRIGNFWLRDLAPGQWRILTPEETGLVGG
jgi:pseudouridine synthase